MKLEIYCDGSYHDGVGGWSSIWVVTDNHHNILTTYICGFCTDDIVTNNRMELQPVIESVEMLKKFPVSMFDKILLYSDSQYVIKAINNWYTRKRNKNKDLWDLYKISRDSCPHKIDYKWLKGHAGTYYNELADKYAGEARIHRIEISKLTEMTSIE